MRHLQRPAETSRDVFVASVSNIQNAALKNRLTAYLPTIEQASADYEQAQGELARCMVVRRDDVPAGVTRKELLNVYDWKFARRGQPGRRFYDRIKMGSPLGRCPLCGKGTVSQLDHNFEKGAYPVLAVTPVNLVPACADCNRKKEDATLDEQENTLHPYFHNLDDVRWLHARVVHDSPPTIEYLAQPPAGVSPRLAARATNHLKVYGLEMAYSLEAARHMTEIRMLLQGEFDDGGAAFVRDYLHKVAGSCESAARNSWQTALYHALALDNWFCTTGFSLLGQ